MRRAHIGHTQPTNNAVRRDASLLECSGTFTPCCQVPLSAADALAWIEQFDAFPCQALDSSIVKSAAEISQRHRISYWDGAIAAAAEALGARTLFTEDLSHGQLYGTVRVENPFRGLT